ncbi:hypothetical protein SDC9_202905 [bioreactor metagenome]|uniref:Uncharacterized protein n=1 Tax=bioreactor metagenome TaxID=1076179 RepID=A0A645IUX9_9ZZZZ
MGTGNADELEVPRVPSAFITIDVWAGTFNNEDVSRRHFVPDAVGIKRAAACDGMFDQQPSGHCVPAGDVMVIGRRVRASASGGIKVKRWKP